MFKLMCQTKCRFLFIAITSVLIITQGGYGDELADPAAQWYHKQATWLETRLGFMESRQRNASIRVKPYLLDFGRDDFTLAAWIRTRSGGTILAKAPDGDTWAPQGKSWFVRDGRLCYDIGWVGVVTSRGSVADGNWHHVALTKQGDRIAFYIDGQPDGSGSLQGESDPQNHVLKAGFTNGNFPSPSGFTGALDDLAMISGTLPAEAIARLAAGESVAGQARLVGYWPFNGNARESQGQFAPVTVKGQISWCKGRDSQALALNGHDTIILAAHQETAEYEKPLRACLERDFPDDQSRREMNWEDEDQIWTRPWPYGHWPELAGRYARATRRDQALYDQAISLVDGVNNLTGLQKIRNLYLQSRMVAAFRNETISCQPDNLEKTVRYILSALPDKFPQGYAYLADLAALKKDIATGVSHHPGIQWIDSVSDELKHIRQEILVKHNPLLDFDELIFIKRYTYQSSHYYTDYIDGCDYYGGNLCILSLKDGAVRELIPSMANGIFGRFDLSYDGRRIVFDWKRDNDSGFRIYEVGADGTGLRQLTFTPEDEPGRIRRYSHPAMKSWAGRPVTYRHFTDDMHPCYLPDGGICFISTRCEYGILCDGPDLFSTTVLYRMDADGDQMEKLSNSSVSEAAPSIMNDGRVLYTRWEYVDKGAVSVKCLWAMNPDGTGSAEIFGNDIAVPTTLLFGRAVPGNNHQFITLATPHCCPIPGLGAVLRIDTRQDIRTTDPIHYVTPDIQIDPTGHTWLRHRRDGQWVNDREGPIYKDPYPLSEHMILTAHNPDKPWNDPIAYGLYLLDDFGNCAPIYIDPDISCWQPVPLRARSRPPVIQSNRDEQLARQNLAHCIVTDVYRGMEGVKRGTIKYLRINEQVPRPWSARRKWGGDEYDQQHAVITKATHLGLKVQHGIVPVHEDGSASFLVPADRNIFFQALDENYMEVQRERTYVNYRPGEIRSCVGCHEQTRFAPATPVKVARALRLPPVMPGPQPGEISGARPLHYPTDVQPILDRHCIRCHGGEKPEANFDLTGTPTTLFCRSYESILDRKLITVIGENHPKWENVHYLPPYSLGSHRSQLVAQLLKGHNDVELSPQEMVRLVTWVDSNGQYYGSYFGRRNIQYHNLPDFRPAPDFEIATCAGEIIKNSRRVNLSN